MTVRNNPRSIGYGKTYALTLNLSPWGRGILMFDPFFCFGCG
jgi:hypothetical protein